MILSKFQIKTIGVVCMLAVSTLSVWAQTPMSLYYLENVPQSNFVNPAMTPRANGYIGVPMVNSIYISHQSDMSVKTFLQKDGSQWVSPLDANFDYGKIYDQIGKCANITEEQAISPIIFGFKLKKGYFTFAYSEKLKTSARIPVDMFKMAEKGFPNGSSFDLSPLGVDATYYREFSFGYARKINQALTLGVHLKPLFGLAATKFDFKKFNLNTSVDDWNFNVDGNIYSSLPLDVYSGPDGKPDSLEFKDLSGSDIRKQVANFSNPGAAIDLGAVYELNDKWSFSAALSNLGFISWKSNLNSVSAHGSFAFKGLDANILEMDSLDGAFSDLADSIQTVINYKSGHNRFKTYLTPIATFGASYQANYTVSFGFISQSYFQKNNYRQYFNFSTNVNLYHFLSASANYNINVKGVNTLGLGLALKGGPVQFYVMADHIPTRYTKIVDGDSKTLLPSNAKNFNLMMGLNIILGGKGFKDEPMISSY